MISVPSGTAPTKFSTSWGAKGTRVVVSYSAAETTRRQWSIFSGRARAPRRVGNSSSVTGQVNDGSLAACTSFSQIVHAVRHRVCRPLFRTAFTAIIRMRRQSTRASGREWGLFSVVSAFPAYGYNEIEPRCITTSCLSRVVSRTFGTRECGNSEQ